MNGMGTEFKFLDILVMYLQIRTQAKRIARKKSCKTSCMKIIEFFQRGQIRRERCVCSAIIPFARIIPGPCHASLITAVYIYHSSTAVYFPKFIPREEPPEFQVYFRSGFRPIRNKPCRANNSPRDNVRRIDAAATRYQQAD